MLKGSRDAVLEQLVPISIHGQPSVDVYFRDPADPSRHVEVVRLGPEAVAAGLQPGDRIRVSYLIGVVTGIDRAAV